MKTMTVTELTQAIKGLLESRFAYLQVKGEVTNLRQQASGHLYFSLKDSHAQVSAVLFRGNAAKMGRLPKPGDEIVIKGELSLYAPRGSYQIIVRQIEYAGVGELLLKLHELKSQLEKQGWFDPKHKKALPKYPKTIGVVTSPTGSVIQDIIHVLKRRFQNFHLILNPVRVQGDGAAEEIAAAIKAFNHHKLADILIVGRGGGSLEDLWAFNEKQVAEAIFHSKIPVVAAVGHETDLSLADCVADVRAPTPSAAAEISIKELSHQLDFLRQARKRSASNLLQAINTHRVRLQGIQKQPFFSSPYLILSEHMQRMDEATTHLDQSMRTQMTEKKHSLTAFQQHLKGLKPTSQLQSLREKLSLFSHGIQVAWANKQKGLDKNLHGLAQGIDQAQNRHFQKKCELFKRPNFRDTIHLLALKQIRAKKERSSRLISHLTSIDPKNLLKKGYCIPFAEKDHSVMMTSRSLCQGEKLSLLFHDGRVLTTIDEVKPNRD